MLAIINITLPIFLLIAAGYLSVRFRLLEKSHMTGMGRYVLMVAFPGMIFHALSDLRMSDFVIPSYILSYSLAMIVLYVICFFLAWKVFRQGTIAATLNSMGAAYSNSGFVGVPILTMVFSAKVAAVYFGMHVIMENFLALLPTIVLAESSGTRASPVQIVREALKKLSRTPLIVALIAGFVFSFSGLTMPKVLDKLFDLISVSAAPVAIFVILHAELTPSGTTTLHPSANFWLGYTLASASHAQHYN